MKDIEKKLIEEKFKDYLEDSNDLLILKSDRALKDNFEYHSIDYDKRFESLNCNTVQFFEPNKSINSLGIVVNFYEILGKQYALIKKFKQDNKESFFKLLSLECSKHIDKFFQIGSISDEYSLIELNFFFKRCILINLGDKVMISIIDYLNEND
ncbi:unnamed protein product [Brachionus calyciflorus]|uniref:Uncharacterized protein n=1 Tax=Brachionus calyciflorus TaxID=104777 RepID=A0A813YSR9_9BILA|nr:unnamed protein product [Brachionus calyciflorus]